MSFLINKMVGKVLFRKSLGGFTLIEMVVTIGVILLVLPAFFAIIMSISSEQARFLYLQQTKKEGDYVIDYISTKIISEAVSLHSDPEVSASTITCPSSSDGNSLYFKVNKPDKYYSFRFYVNNNIVYFDTYTKTGGLYSHSALSSSKVVFENWDFSCQKKGTSSQIIKTTFDVKPNINRTDLIKVLHYETSSKLRVF